MNLYGTAFKALKSTLEANATYRSLVAWPGASTMYRTFGAYVPASVPSPYVTVEWYAGGYDRRDRADTSRSMWKIAALTDEDPQMALDIQEAIHAALHNQWPNTGGIAGYAGYDPIYEQYPYFDIVIRQGRSYARAGGIYVLCLAPTREV